VRYAFLDLAADEPNRYLVLDATLPPDELAAIVAKRVAKILPQFGEPPEPTGPVAATGPAEPTGLAEPAGPPAPRGADAPSGQAEPAEVGNKVESTVDGHVEATA
jgi:hypothetical protein